MTSSATRVPKDRVSASGGSPSRGSGAKRTWARHLRHWRLHRSGNFIVIVNWLMIGIILIALVLMQRDFEQVCPDGACAIGTLQLQTISTSAASANARWYLGEAAGYAMQEALDDLYASGIASSCSSASGVAVFSYQGNSCVPDTAAIRDALSKSFSSRMEPYSKSYIMEQYASVLPSSYDVTLDTVAIATSRDPLIIARLAPMDTLTDDDATRIERMTDCAATLAKAASDQAGVGGYAPTARPGSAGITPRAFSPSSFTHWVYRALDIDIGFPAYQQYLFMDANTAQGSRLVIDDGTHLDPGVIASRLQPGDLLFFNGDHPQGPHHIGHTGIYLGSGTFAHVTTAGVTISTLAAHLSTPEGTLQAAARVCPDVVSSAAGGASATTGTIGFGTLTPATITLSTDGSPAADQVAATLKQSLASLGITVDQKGVSTSPHLRLSLGTGIDRAGIYYGAPDPVSGAVNPSIASRELRAADQLWRAYQTLLPSTQPQQRGPELILARDPPRAAVATTATGAGTPASASTSTTPGSILPGSALPVGASTSTGSPTTSATTSYPPGIHLDLVAPGSDGITFLSSSNARGTLDEQVASTLALAIYTFLRTDDPRISFKSSSTGSSLGIFDLTAPYDRHDSEETLRKFEKDLESKGFSRYINEQAAAQGIDAALIKAIIKRENDGLDANSGRNPGDPPVSPHDASMGYGLMQIIAPNAYPGLSGAEGACCIGTCGITPDTITDPEKNICCGTCKLKALAERYDNNLELIFVGYNAGPGVADLMKPSINNVQSVAAFNQLLHDSLVHFGIYRSNPDRKVFITSGYVLHGLQYYQFFGGETGGFVDDTMTLAQLRDAPILSSEHVTLLAQQSPDIGRDVSSAAGIAADTYRSLLACLRDGSGQTGDDDATTCVSRLTSPGTTARIDDTSDERILYTHLESITPSGRTLAYTVAVRDIIPPPATRWQSISASGGTLSFMWQENFASDTDQYEIACGGSVLHDTDNTERGWSSPYTAISCNGPLIGGKEYEFSIRARDQPKAINPSNPTQRADNAGTWSAYRVTIPYCCYSPPSTFSPELLTWRNHCEPGESSVGLSNC